MIGRSRIPLAARLIRRVIPADDGCWLFQGPLDQSGYGRISIGGAKGRTLRAHRVAYELERGLIPDGAQLDHLCRVRNCVNPDHLEPVTAAMNVQRSTVGVRVAERNKVRGQITECRRGHPFDAENTYIKPNGYRGCKQCRRQAKRRYLARKASR